MLEKLKDKHDEADAGNAGNPGGSGVQRWKETIKKAADKMKVNLTSAGMSAILKRIAQESNGNPTITNNWDSNAKAGTPSKGLLQYIQPTLSSWVPKGTAANLSSGYAQLVAMFNDSNWLRDISVKGGWGPTGHKKMANGGIIGQHQMIEIAENNKKEAVIPMDAMKSSRAWTLLKKVVDNFADSDNSSSTKPSAAGNDLDALNSKVDKLVKLFETVVGLTSNQTQTIKDTAFDKTHLYRTQSMDQTMHDAQAL